MLWVTLPIILILLLIIAYLLFHSYRSRRRYLTEKEINLFFNNEMELSGETEANIDVGGWLPTQFPSQLEISKENIKLSQIIFNGVFGSVYRGTLSSQQNGDNEEQVTVKIPRSEYVNQQLKIILTEMEILCYLGGGHANIINFLGAYTKEVARGNIYVVMEFCEHGTLHDHLQEMRRSQSEKDGQSSLDVYQLYKFSQEIASALDYITKKGVIHRAISTSNVMVNSEYSCKITDFALARKLDENGEYVEKDKLPLPWRWMAPESWKNMVFSVKTDVWSYGVTLWEIFSLGSVPYSRCSWTQSFVRELDNGMRMKKAMHATDEVHGKLLSCWNSIPADRPSFAEMVAFFLDLRSKEYVILYDK